MIRIKKVPGTHNGGVKFFNEDGSEINSVAACDVRMRPDEICTATLELYVEDIDIEAEPLLSIGTVKRMTEYYGMELVEGKEGESC